jgi:hypothetical protein
LHSGGAAGRSLADLGDDAASVESHRQGMYHPPPSPLYDSSQPLTL